MITYYGYEKCGTCRKAKAWLKAHAVAFSERDITCNPPSEAVLRVLLQSGACTLGELFNRSGELYRSMNMKDRLKSLSEPEAIRLLAAHGKLIKRPIITDGRRHTVGFDEERMKIWAKPGPK